MSDTPSPAQSGLFYNIVITAVDKAQIQDAVERMSKVFNLAPEVAGQILNGLPVAFLTNLARNEIKVLKPKLVELSGKGIEFTITPSLSPTLPRVVWATPPHYKEGPAGAVIQYVDFQWRGNAFVCPNCGETFVFQRVGNPFNTYQKFVKEHPAQVVTLKPAEQPVSSHPAEENGAVMELTPIEQPTEWVEENAAEPVDVLQPEPAESESAEEPQEIVEAPEVIEEIPVEEATCSVFLSGLSSNEKREVAAKIIAEVKNIPQAKARELTQRVLVPVLKDVTESEAQMCLEKFKEAGITGRITKKPS